jgi:transcriptional regulator with XRE-family HTH domain
MFPSRLKELRKERGLTQLQIAEKLGMARTTYSGYENGTRETDHETLNKIANFFDTNVDYLLGRHNNRHLSFLDKVRSGEGISEQTAARDYSYFLKEIEREFPNADLNDPDTIRHIKKAVSFVLDFLDDEDKK